MSKLSVGFLAVLLMILSPLANAEYQSPRQILREATHQYVHNKISAAELVETFADTKGNSLSNIEILIEEILNAGAPAAAKKAKLEELRYAFQQAEAASVRERIERSRKFADAGAFVGAVGVVVFNMWGMPDSDIALVDVLSFVVKVGAGTVGGIIAGMHINRLMEVPSLIEQVKIDVVIGQLNETCDRLLVNNELATEFAL